MAVLSPLLFPVVMDAVSSEARSGLPSELLYADDLVLMAPTLEKPDRRVVGWRVSLPDKGLRVNAEDDCKLWKVASWCLWERSAGKLC